MVHTVLKWSLISLIGLNLVRFISVWLYTIIVLLHVSYPGIVGVYYISLIALYS